MNPSKKFEELGGTNPKLFIVLVILFSVFLTIIVYGIKNYTEEKFISYEEKCLSDEEDCFYSWSFYIETPNGQISEKEISRQWLEEGNFECLSICPEGYMESFLADIRFCEYALKNPRNELYQGTIVDDTCYKWQVYDYIVESVTK